MTDPDTSLEERLREKITQQSEGDPDTETESTDSEATEAEGEHYDDEENDESESEAMDGDVGEAVQMIAEAAEEDVTPTQVQEMLAPLFGEEDTTDDAGEMAADTEDAEESIGEAEVDINAEALVDDLSETIEEAVDEAVPDDVVTESDLEEHVESELDDVVSALADETREVMQQADVSSTPSPSGGGVEAELTTDDLFSDSSDTDTDSGTAGGDD